MDTCCKALKEIINLTFCWRWAHNDNNFNAAGRKRRTVENRYEGPDPNLSI